MKKKRLFPASSLLESLNHKRKYKRRKKNRYEVQVGKKERGRGREKKMIDSRVTDRQIETRDRYYDTLVT